MKTLALVLTAAGVLAAQQQYDLLLKGGTLIDPKNRIHAKRDVAIAGGKVAAVAESIDAKRAFKTVDVSGLYVAPGFIDIHAHFWGVYATGLHPDSHTLRAGVTTVADAGGSGWRNFPEFRKRVMDTALVRVLAWLNIVGRGMDGRAAEQLVEDMDPKAAAAMVQSNRDVIVGIKTAHFAAPQWTAVDRSVEAGTIANVPVMVDFGTFRPERPFDDVVHPINAFIHQHSTLWSGRANARHANGLDEVRYAFVRRVGGQCRLRRRCLCHGRGSCRRSRCGLHRRW